jgi:hypothetical protein
VILRVELVVLRLLGVPQVLICHVSRVADSGM